MNNLKEKLGTRLKELRKNKGYTQEHLAEMLDLSTRQLIRIENGHNFPSVEMIEKILQIFNIELKSLFDFKKSIVSQSNSTIKNDLYNSILLKLEKISSNQNKMKYIKLAIESLESRESLEKLKVLLQGMELTLPKIPTIKE